MSATALPEVSRRGEASGRSWWTRLGLVAAALAVLVGCYSEPDPETIEIVVPHGTQFRLMAGGQVVVMPTVLEMRVGDTLIIRNEDIIAHSVGPYVVAAGDELNLRYGSPGVFEGYCPLSEDQRYEIIVKDKRAW